MWKEMTGARCPQGRSFGWSSTAWACALRRQTKCWGLRRRRYKLNPPLGPCVPSWRRTPPVQPQALASYPTVRLGIDLELPKLGR